MSQLWEQIDDEGWDMMNKNQVLMKAAYENSYNLDLELEWLLP